jgi:hypothetical protein
MHGKCMIRNDNINLIIPNWRRGASLWFAVGFFVTSAHGAALTANRKEISVRQLAPIEFGTVAGNGGTVAIAPATGARTVSPSLSALGGQYGQAEFEIIGEPSEEVTVIVPERVAMDNKNGQGGLALEKLAADPAGVVTLDANGRARVKIGGVLHVPPSSAQGSFQGYFDIDARYLH